MARKEWIALLLAGGQGSRLGALTRDLAKPAVPFGGKYRIIDFSLSNCTASNIDTVGVLTQYKPFMLHEHVGIGTAWDLAVEGGGVSILPPFTRESGGSWYKGTANAIYQNSDFIDHYNPDYVLVISGDHIYEMDYSKMLEFHKAKSADATIAVMEVPWHEASRFGIMKTAEDGRITEFFEKPKEPKSNLASMGIYIFNWKLLKEFLAMDDKDEKSSNDFGKDVIPAILRAGKRLFAYKFEGYWRDVGTIESYYDAHMDLLGESPVFDICGHEKRLLSKSPVMPPHYIGDRAKIRNSIVTDGCVIEGRVENSILSAGARVGAGAVVRNSILLPGAKVAAGAVVGRAILGEGSLIEENCMIGLCSEESPNEGPITVVANGEVVGTGACVKPGSVVKTDEPAQQEGR
ncbi:MAG TPA: glucose-1-phosphate adenylyltransferase [Bacillota bacterium]|nr:glucose-1-phosphate adenylyltransferase [Bacillota bacterium]HOA15544.1 glucose-1-phosphate adenylyltransferase [Bacillota bacterium]HOG52735.1 glucose-1-phosphate adenylyltransferase [Bacillota bacterium]